jgi:hypothetical protein
MCTFLTAPTSHQLSMHPSNSSSDVDVESHSSDIHTCMDETQHIHSTFDTTNPNEKYLPSDVENGVQSSVTAPDLFTRWHIWYADASNRRKKQIMLLSVCLVGFIILVIITATESARKEVKTTPPAVVYGIRLPVSVIPTLYEMELNVSLVTDSAHFIGVISMELDFHIKTSEIIFHARDLDISELLFTIPSISLTNIGNIDNTVIVPIGNYIGEFDLYRVILPFFMSPGQHAILSMKFGAPIGRGLAGFYLSDYKDKNGLSHTIASTQFEGQSISSLLYRDRWMYI